MLTKVIAATVALLMLSGTAHAKQKPAQSPLVQALADCRGQADDAARLRCYDATAAALTAAAAQGDVVVVDQQDLKTARRALFGFSLPKLPFFGGDRSADDPQEELTAQVASARSLGNGKWQLRLSDGAVWETTEAGTATMKPPSAGNSLTIKRGSLGSYFLRVDGQRGLRGKRVS